MRRKSYFRYEAPTFAMYCFDTNVETLEIYSDYYTKQLEWFAESLKTETSKHIVIASHIIYNTAYRNPLIDEVTKCCSAYNNKSIYTFGDKDYNYANTTGKVAFAIGGHRHVDQQGTINDIPYVITTNTSGYGYYESLPLDLCAIDWSASKLYLYRCEIGKEGSIRTIDILT